MKKILYALSLTLLLIIEAHSLSSNTESTSTATIVACGDNILYHGNHRDAAINANGGRSYDYRPTYRYVKPIIANADIAFLNQETPISESSPIASYPRFNSPKVLAQDLAEVGFDVVSLANNHALDCGMRGFTESTKALKQAGISPIGISEKANQAPLFYEKKGIKFAFLAYTYGTNIQEMSEDNISPACFHKDRAVAETASAKEKADFVIVSLHFGNENQSTPSNEQREIAKALAESGADLILGHHPHVLQPIEWIEGKENRKTLVAYSLGNFVHEQAYEQNALGGILSVKVQKRGDRTTVSEAVLIPTVCHFDADFSPNEVWLLQDYPHSLASTHAVKSYYGNPFSKKGLLAYLQKTVSIRFLQSK